MSGFNASIAIYMEEEWDHIVGEDVSITIRANSNGKGTAESIKRLILAEDTKFCSYDLGSKLCQHQT